MIEFNDSNFDTNIGLTPELVVIDFWSPWCRPCNMLNPIIKSIAEKNSSIVVGKLNTIENPITTAKFNISGIPTILFLKEGKIAERLLGYQTEEKLQKIIEKLK